MFKTLIAKFRIYGPRKFFSYFFIEVKRHVVMGLIRKSYSQQGEDLVIDRLLNYKNEGFYVDVGANNPSHFNNTKRFYKRGWQGINIEPDINNYQKFLKQRKRDINLNMGIANEKGTMIFYKFFPDTLSTFSDKEASEYLKQGYILKEKKDVEVKPLFEVLEEHCQGKPLDFMSIDTEGFDMEVLRSNNWNKFIPFLICIESVRHTMDGVGNLKDDDCDSFLLEKGYKKVFDNGLNSIYEHAPL